MLEGGEADTDMDRVAKMTTTGIHSAVVILGVPGGRR